MLHALLSVMLCIVNDKKKAAIICSILEGILLSPIYIKFLLLCNKSKLNYEKLCKSEEYIAPILFIFY